VVSATVPHGRILDFLDLSKGATSTFSLNIKSQFVPQRKHISSELNFFLNINIQFVPHRKHIPSALFSLNINI
jgi:hypothetical protein